MRAILKFIVTPKKLMYALLSIMQVALASLNSTLTTRAFAHQTANVRIAAGNRNTSVNPEQPNKQNDHRFDIWHGSTLAVEHKM